jgi:hypothetical protein
MPSARVSSVLKGILAVYKTRLDITMSRKREGEEWKVQDRCMIFEVLLSALDEGRRVG